MRVLACVLFALCALPATASSSPGHLPPPATLEGRSVKLLSPNREAVDTTSVRLVDGLDPVRTEQLPALDMGGGVGSDARQILALLLGFIPGFGLGHLIARDKQGFVLFLIIDIVLYVAWWVPWVGFKLSPFGFIGGLVWLVVHIFQGLDAYAEAGGERLIELNRERAVRIAAAPGREEDPTTTRLFSFAF